MRSSPACSRRARCSRMSSDAPGVGADDAAPRAPVVSAKVDGIYQELILDHYRRPRNKGVLEGADAAATRKNPLCGDVIDVMLAWEDGRVADVRFTGRGCSISQASASMMTNAVRGRTAAEIDVVLRRFAAMLHGDRTAADDESLGELRALSGVARFPARVTCASLAWSALGDALGDARR
jgi:nitrogen fixation NifU-like protein